MAWSHIGALLVMLVVGWVPETPPTASRTALFQMSYLQVPPRQDDELERCEAGCDAQESEDRQRCMYRYGNGGEAYSDCIAPLPRRTRLCKLRCD